MSAPYVCFRCRHHLLVKLRPLAKQPWQTRLSSSFVPLADACAIDVDKDRQELLDIAADTKRHAISQRQKRAARRPRPTQQDEVDNTGRLLESYLERPSQPRPGDLHDAASKTLNIYSCIERLAKMTSDRNAKIADTWSFFVENLGPRTWTDNDQRLQLWSFKKSVADLYTRLAIERKENTVGVPSVSTICETYLSMDMMSELQWRKLVDDLIDQLMTIRGKISQGAAIEDAHGELLYGTHAALQEYAAQEVQLTEDLLGAWRSLLMPRNQTFTSSDTASIGNTVDWSFLDKVAILKPSRTPLQKQFEKLFRAKPSNNKPRTLALAMRTFHLVLDSGQPVEGFRARSHPLIKCLAALFATIDTPPPVLAKTFKELQDLEASWRGHMNWEHLREQAEDIYRSEYLPTQDDIGSAVGTASAKSNLAGRVSYSAGAMHSKLNNALASKNHRAVTSLWKMARAWPALSSERQGDEQALEHEQMLSHRLCHHFILVFMALKQPEAAIEVWNHMLDVSLTPGQATWNSMLAGCKRARDVEGMEVIWNKLVASSTRPDALCWNTRISGLIELGKPEQGIMALEEMGRLWLKAAQRKTRSSAIPDIGDIDGIVKPTVANINTALAGLMRRRYSHFANNVLQWGAKLNIKPDIITFNTLLRPLVRSGNLASINALLDNMKAQQVQPDVATFTTILDETFAAASDMTPEQQLEVVTSTFADMEASGVQANQVTYGKIIHALLQTKDNDMSAVNAVMRKMNEQGILPNSFIYTSLLSRHFSQDPPDLEAIRSIITQVCAQKHTVDHIFWDRVIEGYSRLGDTNSALDVLSRGYIDSKNVGYWAVSCLLEALAHNEEWKLAKELVMNVKADRGGPPSPTKKGVEGQHEFWRLAEGFGLLNTL